MRVVVVGGGLAGLRVAKKLGALLVTDSKEFVFLPLLPDALNGVVPSKELDYHNVLFGRVSEVFPQENKIVVDEKKIPYDVLIIASGTHAFTGVKGVDEFAHTFYSLSDLEKAQSLLEKKSCVVVGAGPTGVELAMELSLHMKVTLVQRSAQILDRMSVRARKYAEQQLSKAGVNIICEVHCVEINEEGVVAHDKTIPGEVVFWCAGVEANTFPGLHAEKGFLVNKYLQTEHKNIFVIGDAAQTGSPLTAQAAMQEADLVSKNVLRFSQNKKLLPFKYRHKGSMLGLGGVAYIETFIHVKGVLAALLRRFYYSWLLRRY